MLNSLKNIHETARKIAARERVSAVRIFADILWCWLRYGATREDYEIHDFVRLSGVARGNVVGYKKYLLLEKWFNAPETKAKVDNKRGFLENYGEFLGREWLALAGTAEDRVRAFFERHARVIQKPEDSSQGKGVRRWESADVLAAPALFSEVIRGGVSLRDALFSIRKWRASTTSASTRSASIPSSTVTAKSRFFPR